MLAMLLLVACADETKLDTDNPDGTSECGDGTDGQDWWADADGDGYGDPESTRAACTMPSGYADNDDDCDDAAADVYPGAPEHCDGIDHDCDGGVDDEDAIDATTYYVDGDSDGWGGEATIQACSPSGTAVEQGGDCEDGDGTVHPGATDVCGDGVDQDCSGVDRACVLEETGILGAEAHDGLGHAMDCGDIDDDGYDDVAVGLADATTNPEGGVALLVGPISGLVSVSDTVAAVPGDPDGDLVGISLSLGDVNGDARADLLVGASGEDTGATGGGGAHLYLAPFSGELASPELSVYGEGETDILGQSVRIGDVGGAQPSVLLTASWADYAAPDAGAIYVFSASTTGTHPASDADAVLYGTTDSAHFGYASNPAGDVNGDGAGDLVVGSPNEDAGVARLFFGPFGSDVADTDADTTLTGENTDDSAGQKVTAAGDVDGDGYADVVVTAPTWSGTYNDAGRAYLLRGPLADDVSLADAAWTATGEEDGERCGLGVQASLVLADDVYGVAVGCPYSGDDDKGRIAVFRAPFAGAAAMSDAPSTYWGDPGDEAARAMTSGDLDGDGHSDLLVGAPNDDTADTDAGAIWVIWGAGL